MKDISKLYKNLTNDERVRLFIEAAARQDLEELDKLNDTCPQKTYRGEDWYYTRMKHRYFNIALQYRITGDRLLMIALMSFLATLAYDDDETSEKMDEAFKTVMARYKGRELAWAKFCDQLGVDGETLKKAASVEDDFAHEFLMTLGIINVDPSLEAESNCFEMLTSMASQTTAMK